MAVRVLFLSRFNSARSQIAEGFLRRLGGAAVDVHSAGSAALGLDPRAVLVMAERDIDIGEQRSKEVEEYMGSARFDYVVTVCVQGEDECPVFSGEAIREYWPFEDPARTEGGDDVRMAMFREVRDQVEARVRLWIEAHRRELASRPAPSVSRRVQEAVGQDHAMDRDELVASGRRTAP